MPKRKKPVKRASQSSRRKQTNGFNVYKPLLVFGLLAVLFGFTSIAGSLMAKNLTKDMPGDLFDIFLIPAILVFAPLLLVQVSLKNIPTITYTLTKKIVISITLVAALLVSFAHFGRTYNYFVGASEMIDQAYNNIDVLYQKRFAVIPELTLSINFYSAYEKEVIQSIAEARSWYARAATPEEKISSINAFDDAVKTFVITMEQYPNLKTNVLIDRFITVLTDTENDIAKEKKFYNERVALYNKYYKSFPYTIIARLAGNKEKAYFRQTPFIQQ